MTNGGGPETNVGKGERLGSAVAGVVLIGRALSRPTWGRIAAGGTMVMLPVLLFSLIVRRFLISGLTAGAVKG